MKMRASCNARKRNSDDQLTQVRRQRSHFRKKGFHSEHMWSHCSPASVTSIIMALICISGGSYIKLHNTTRRKNSANSAITLVRISLQRVVLLLKITVNRLNRGAFIKILLF